jgi:hypothetical protein
MSASRSCRCFVEKRGDVFGLGLRIAFRDIPDVRAIVTTEIVDMSVLAQSGQPTKVCGLTRRTFRMRHRREGIRIVGHGGFLVWASLKSRCSSEEQLAQSSVSSRVNRRRRPTTRTRR